MENCKEIHACRLCGSDKINVVLDFGETPLANNFLTYQQALEPQAKYPLQAYLCENCGAVGLKHSVNPEVLFKNYFYESSTSASFRKHFEDYAKSVSEFCGLKQGDVVVDVGCNDLITLKPMKALGFKAIGIEPATNIVEKYKTPEIPVVNDFLTKEVAAKVAQEFGDAKLVTCNNCFAHLSDYHGFIESVKILLDDEGYFVFENSYLLDTINNGDAGQIYHEHSAFHSLKPLQKFFRRHGMNIVHVERNNIQCGSIRVFVKKTNGEAVDYQSVQDLIQLEEEAGLYKLETYQKMTAKVTENGERLRELLVKLHESGQKIAVYAWPAKFTTLASLWNVSQYINFVIEDAVSKQGIIAPIGNFVISDKSKLDQSDYCIIGAYNFNEVIKKNNSQYVGKWIEILPVVKVNI